MVDRGLYLEEHGVAAWKRLIQVVADAKDGDLLAPVTVVVPTQYAGLSLRRSLGGRRGLVNVRFLVPARLAEHLGAPALAEQGKAPLSPLVELAAIRATAGEVSAGGPLGRIAHHPNLHASLRDTFRGLARLSAESLASLGGLDPLHAQMVRWYRAFRARRRGYYDREELALAAAAAVETGEAAIALGDLGFIVFHLVHDLTAGEMALVSALGKKGLGAAVFGLAGEEEVDGATRRLASRLESALGPARAAPPSEPGARAEHLASAPDAYEEVRWVVRRIVRQAEAGRPLHRLGVFYRQRDPYAALIPSQLRLAGIPGAGPDPTPLRDTPAGKLLRLLMEVVSSDLSRESVMRWITEAPVSLDPSDPARWEVVSRQAGVVKGLQQWQQRLARYRNGMARHLAEAGNREDEGAARRAGLGARLSSAERLTEFIQELAAHPPPADGSPWRAFAEWARGRLHRYARDPASWPEAHQVSCDRVARLLDDLGGLDAVAPGTDVAEFGALLDEALNAPAGRTGLTGTGVFVGPVAAAQAMQLDAVYLVGLAAGAFPPFVADDPMLPDRVRQAIGEAERLPLRQARRLEERRLFLAALAAGDERVLSYPRADSSAQRGQHPSAWLLDEAARLHGSPVGSADLVKLGATSWLSIIHSAEDALQYATSLAAADLHDYDVASLARWRSRGRNLDDHFLASAGGPLHRALRMEKGRWGAAFTGWDGCLATLAGTSDRLALPADGELAATRLERWATCPFRYFLSDVLGLAMLERPEEVLSISGLDRGRLLHTILERFLRATMARDELPAFGEPWGERHLRWLFAIAEEEFRTVEGHGLTGRRLLWQAAREEIRQDLAAFLDEDSRWRADGRWQPRWVEHRFGFHPDAGFAPVEVILPSGAAVRFRGLVDRVDVDASGTKAAVIDYKSGSVYPYDDMKRDPLGGGRRLQLPVYALAVRAALEGVDEVEAHYWFVTARGGFERRRVPLAKVEDRFRAVIGAIAAGIQQGLFPPSPGQPGRHGRPENCQFCDFDRVCPANRDVLWARKRQDPVLAPYLRLLGEGPNEGDQP